jgi:Heparinase II/III N-terminus/Heparinase II/III-like protein
MRGLIFLLTLLSCAYSANICGQNSTIGYSVIAALNLSYPGLESVASFAAQNDLDSACEALATYYKTANTAAWLRIPNVPTPSSKLAGGVVDNMVFNDTFYLSGVDTTAKVPRNADGGLDWLDKGPRGDVEFMNCLNRFDSFTWLLQAWLETGNQLYVSYFDALIKDWVLHLPCPNASIPSAHKCAPLGISGPTCSWDVAYPQTCMTGVSESPWRSLEMGIRTATAWPPAFFGFQKADGWTTSARVLLVLAVAEHNSALLVDGGHPGSGTPNWEMEQWTGLLTSTVVFPELQNTSSLQATAIYYLDALLNQSVYPDGVETEQASGYDMWTASEFFSVTNLLNISGNPDPLAFRTRVEAMWNYGSLVADPNGCLPRNGDSDLCSGGYSENITSFYNRNDWRYVFTNGASGEVPPTFATDGPSIMFPWAGQCVLRSGFSRNATWVWFDVGPYGSSGHGHRDKLNIVVRARGTMLLADSGRFAYAGTDLSNTLHTQYAAYTHAHNSLTFDGCDQLPNPAVATAPISSDNWSFSPAVDTAFGTMSFYKGLQGSVNHTRAIHYQRALVGNPLPEADGDWLVVVDVVESDRPRFVEAYWHTHPNASVSVDGKGNAIVSGAYVLSGVPSEAQVCLYSAPGNSFASSWNSSVVIRGQYQNATTNSMWQGWYSQSYDDAWPAGTLQYDAQMVVNNAYFVWLIVPLSQSQACTDSVQVTGLSSTGVNVQVTVNGQQTDFVVKWA